MNPQVWIDTRWITPKIGVAAPESSYFLAVEADNVVLIVYADFVVMPALRCEILVVLIVLLPRPRAVGRDRSLCASANGLAETRIAARLFVDLNFKSGMHSDKSGVVRRVDRSGAGSGRRGSRKRTKTPELSLLLPPISLDESSKFVPSEGCSGWRTDTTADQKGTSFSNRHVSKEEFYCLLVSSV